MHVTLVNTITAADIAAHMHVMLINTITAADIAAQMHLIWQMQRPT